MRQCEPPRAGQTKQRSEERRQVPHIRRSTGQTGQERRGTTRSTDTTMYEPPTRRTSSQDGFTTPQGLRSSHALHLNSRRKCRHYRAPALHDRLGPETPTKPPDRERVTAPRYDPPHARRRHSQKLARRQQYHETNATHGMARSSGTSSARPWTTSLSTCNQPHE